MAKLFISYAHRDAGIVLKIVDDLRQAGHDVWIDTRRIEGGSLWAEEIAKGILDCEIFVLVVSASSISSDYVRRELDVAFDATKKVLPLRIENVEYPIRWRYQLAGIQYIEYQTPHWAERMLIALSERVSSASSEQVTGKLRNPYSIRPILEPIERRLILSNREKELNQAISYLEEHRLLLVTGMPGIGKSTFACALLDFRPPDSPEVFWYDFERQKSSGNTLGVLLDRISGYLDVTLGMDARQRVMAFRESRENASVDDVDRLIQCLNEASPIWMVFDNLETVLSRDTQEFAEEGLATLFDSLKNSKHKARIIITNPYVPILKTGELYLEVGTQPLVLDGFDNASSIEFLRAYGLQDISDEKLELVIRKVHGHPFTLNHVAHYIQSMGLEPALEDLEGGLEEVSSRFAESLERRISAAEFATLQLLTILNRGMRLTGLCHVAQVKPSTIMHLREKGLLQKNEAGFFWLHNIVRNSIKAGDPGRLKQAQWRAMDYYRRQALPPVRQSIDDYADVLEWHHHAVGAADVISSHAALYSTGMVDQLLEWNEYDLLLKLCERTLSVMYEIQADTSQVLATLSNLETIRLHHTLANTYFLLADYQSSIAHLESANRLVQSEDNGELKIRLKIDLSESYYLNGQHELALQLCDQVTGLFSAIVDDSLRAKFLHLRGILQRDSGNAEAAINDLEDALTLYMSLNRLINIGNARVDLGNVYFFQNRFGEALVNYQQALAAFETQADMRGIVISHLNTADIMLQSEEYARALEEIQPGLEIARRRKFTEYEIMSGLVLIESRIACSQFGEASQELERLSPVILKRASVRFTGYELALRGHLHARRNEAAQARNRFADALRLLTAPGCQYEYARACLLFASFLKEQGDTKRARDTLSRAGSAFTQINSQLGLQAVKRLLETIPAA